MQRRSWIAAVAVIAVLAAAYGVDDHVIPRAGFHVIPQVLAYTCFT
jgi:hypothetical protein